MLGVMRKQLLRCRQPAPPISAHRRGLAKRVRRRHRTRRKPSGALDHVSRPPHVLVHRATSAGLTAVAAPRKDPDRPGLREQLLAQRLRDIDTVTLAGLTIPHTHAGAALQLIGAQVQRVGYAQPRVQAHLTHGPIGRRHGREYQRQHIIVDPVSSSHIHTPYTDPHRDTRYGYMRIT